ncbi:hypothetical protein FA95DRAFT_893215 [Auriscalpium vulgare]|uniref:Uncharacterized protein n=1 Tax=Auriscalpium vulgare TaxID=40419 RepID=A0ACB8RZN3_9AGAM|nr:hypothetical protein FA95DRAFT_893215 [Auriscalpium vulgare]
MPDASKLPPAHLVSLPSLSSSLSSLPQAKSLANVNVYTSPMSAQVAAAQSEAKLKKALSNNATSHSQQVPYCQMPPPQASSGHAQQPLMMRKPVRTKLQA